MEGLALWGGVECTINRVGDRWHSQLARTGHESRIGDLELFADLGLRTLRYPVLWEHCAPDSLSSIDWSWAEARLGRLRALGIAPIVGLLHHGSGPRYCDLASTQFPQALARFAGEVARRFPWVESYTPVNEPLTTARFCALYGHWYPHARDDRSFVRVLLNECAGVRAAMREIRTVNPAARLVQTDDLGTTYATAAVAYQAAFDNERRWLTWDILCGKVSSGHPMRSFLIGNGASPDELDSFVHSPCPPDIIGINHYITSDRHLDENLGAYPQACWGGNGIDRYADVEAVRQLEGAYQGWRIIEHAWDRYRIPLALTEVHMGCTREEQVRWLHDAWCAAEDARARGCAVLAVTAWALLGSYDWDSLLTSSAGHYESGAFDVRGGTPRPTAVAALISALCRKQPLLDATLDSPGWWHSPRKHLGDKRTTSQCGERRAHRRAPRPLLICGTGSLGQAFAHACRTRGLEHRLLEPARPGVCSAAAVERQVREHRAWALVNATHYARVDEAEEDPDACFRTNALGTYVLARVAARRRVRLLSFSSDQVFSGAAQMPYVESSATAPINTCGRSNAAAEVLLRTICPQALCVRTAALFGTERPGGFLPRALQALEAGGAFRAMSDVTITPTYIADLVDAALDLLLDGENGLWHLVNGESLTWAEFALRAARICGVPERGLRAEPLTSFELRAARPRFSALASERGQLLPPLEDALRRFAGSWSIGSMRTGLEAAAPGSR